MFSYLRSNIAILPVSTCNDSSQVRRIVGRENQESMSRLVLLMVVPTLIIGECRHLPNTRDPLIQLIDSSSYNQYSRYQE